MVGAVVAAFFGDTMVDVGAVVGIFCPTAKVAEAVIDAALTICVFDIAGDVGVIIVLLC